MTDCVNLLGAGGHAKVVMAAARAAGIAVVGVFDHDPIKVGAMLMGKAVVSPLPADDWWVNRVAHLAIGSNVIRKRLSSELACRWLTILHPLALVDQSVTLGDGVFVSTSAVIQPDSRIGAGTIVNTAAIVEHDCLVGDYCHLAPTSCLGGGVVVGSGSLIGMGAHVLPGVRIGVGVVIGAGALVRSDVKDGTVAVGVPARTLKDI